MRRWRGGCARWEFSGYGYGHWIVRVKNDRLPVKASKAGNLRSWAFHTVQPSVDLTLNDVERCIGEFAGRNVTRLKVLVCAGKKKAILTMARTSPEHVGYCEETYGTNSRTSL